MIRVIVPPPLRSLAKIEGEVLLEVQAPVSVATVLDALEAKYPSLSGTVRDRLTKQRRPFMRFFACGEDLSHDAPEKPLPKEVVSGSEPFLIVGAIAGGAA